MSRPDFAVRYQNVIVCRCCRQVKPIKGSSGGGPRRHKRTCADCRKALVS